MRPGRRLTPDERSRIERLLRSSDMTMPEIARRFEVSGGLVHLINRQGQIRDYQASMRWTVGEQKFDRTQI